MSDTPNYEHEMSEDAKAMAEKLRAAVQEMFPGVEVKMRGLGEVPQASPHPTLESLREELSHVDSDFESALTQVSDIADVDSVLRGVLRMVIDGDVSSLREHFAEHGEPYASLTDKELANLASMRLNMNNPVTAAVAAVTGAMLAREGFAMEDIEAPAGSGRFLLQMQCLRLRGHSLVRVAREELARLNADDR